MTRRTRPNKARRALAAQGRDARRARFRNLIDRAGRLTLTPQEADALRGAAEAEFTESDNLRATVGGQQSAIRRLSEQLDAAHEAIREAEQAAADYREQLRMHRAVEEHQAATEERARTPQPVRPASPCQAQQRPNYDYCPCNGMCHQCDDSPCDECQPTPTTSTPEQQP